MLPIIPRYKSPAIVLLSTGLQVTMFYELVTQVLIREVLIWGLADITKLWFEHNRFYIIHWKIVAYFFRHVSSF